MLTTSEVNININYQVHQDFTKGEHKVDLIYKFKVTLD